LEIVRSIKLVLQSPEQGRVRIHRYRRYGKRARGAGLGSIATVTVLQKGRHYIGRMGVVDC
jgi:hypothetical protein